MHCDIERHLVFDPLLQQCSALLLQFGLEGFLVFPRFGLLYSILRFFRCCLLPCTSAQSRIVIQEAEQPVLGGSRPVHTLEVIRVRPGTGLHVVLLRHVYYLEIL